MRSFEIQDNAKPSQAKQGQANQNKVKQGGRRLKGEKREAKGGYVPD
jgi:hypothetical protein